MCNIAHHPAKSVNSVGKRPHAAIEHFVIQPRGEIYESPVEQFKSGQALRQRPLAESGSIPQFNQSLRCWIIQCGSRQEIAQTLENSSKLMLEALQSQQIRRETIQPPACH